MFGFLGTFCITGIHGNPRTLRSTKWCTRVSMSCPFHFIILNLLYTEQQHAWYRCCFVLVSKNRNLIVPCAFIVFVHWECTFDLYRAWREEKTRWMKVFVVLYVQWSYTMIIKKQQTLICSAQNVMVYLWEFLMLREWSKLI